MPQLEGRAPYTSAAAALIVLEMNRDRGLPSPVTTEALVRAGVPESIAPRTFRSFVELGLFDEGGNVAEIMKEFHAVRGEDEYRKAFATWLRQTYSDVLHYADPATDDLKKLTDAFRGYEPAGQRSSMAALLLGLWRHAGLPTTEPDSMSRSPRARRSSSSNGKAEKPKKSTNSSSSQSTPTNRPPAHTVTATADLPPGLVGLLHQIPRSGATWTTGQREAFVNAFVAVLNFTVPVNDSPAAPENGDDP